MFHRLSQLWYIYLDLNILARRQNIDSPIKVLHVYKAALPYSLGGVECVIDTLAQGGLEHQLETRVLALADEAKDAPLNFHGYAVYTQKALFAVASTPVSLSLFSKFNALAKWADVIHYHFPWPMMDLLHLFTSVKKPSIVTYHSDIVAQKRLYQFYKPLMHRFLQQMDCVVATSDNYLASSPVLQLYHEKVRVIPIGIHSEANLEADPQVFRQQFPTLPEQFFLFIGVLRYYKGLSALLEAMRTLNYPLVIAGAGPLELELKAYAQKWNLKHVHFLGSVSAEAKTVLLKQCSAFIFPSHLRSEAFGISLLEAAMHGKPMISCEIGTGTTYINQDQLTGYVMLPKDPEALRSAMQALLENPQRTVEMGQQARQRYLKMFTADQMIKRYVDLYRKILKSTMR